VATAAVDAFPICSQITFGGGPRTSAKLRKSSSLLKIIVPRVRPDGLVAGGAHAEEFNVRATWPERGKFSHEPGTQVLVEEQFHAVV
jgi:hypothetical protein